MNHTENTKHAQVPRSRNTRLTIGLLIYGLYEQNGLEPWLGAADAARKRGVNFICFTGEQLRTTVGFRDQANILYEMVSVENIDGLVFWANSLSNSGDIEGLRSFFKRFDLLRLPMVNVVSSLDGIHSVCTEEYQGIREAIVHLIEVHGCRQLAFLGGPSGNPSADIRYQAYTDVLREYGLPFASDRVVLTGHWHQPWGVDAIRILRDQRNTTFDAVVAANDGLAVGAMKALQERGIRVPDDVAVVGYDNSLESQYASPPLTTVPLLIYEQAYRAVEVVLDLLAGEEVPEQVVIPPKLVIRQSCGCLAHEVTQAAAEPATVTRKSFETALIEQREPLIAAMARVVGTSEQDIGWIEGVVDAFVAEIEGTSPGAFVSTFDKMLRQVVAVGGDVIGCQNALSALRRLLLPYLRDEKELLQAENLWQQARVLLRMITEWDQLRQRAHAEQQVDIVREIGKALITTFDVEGLMDVLARELPRLEIPSCYLAIYEDLQP
jgi:DNA-binding LacI/PurR family transcriptional regulator